MWYTCDYSEPGLWIYSYTLDSFKWNSCANVKLLPYGVHLVFHGRGIAQVNGVYVLRLLIQMELGYDSSDSTYYWAYSSDSEWGSENGRLETSFLTPLPRDVIDYNLWPIMMDGCKQRSDLVQTLCILRSVCTAWRRWIRGTLEGTMYLEAFSNHLVDEYVLAEMEVIQRNRAWKFWYWYWAIELDSILAVVPPLCIGHWLYE